MARTSYVDPEVLEKHQDGVALASAWKRRLSGADRRRLERGELANARSRDDLEAAVLRLLRR